MEDSAEFQGHSRMFWWGFIFLIWFLGQISMGIYTCGLSLGGCAAQAGEDWAEDWAAEELTDEDLQALREEWIGQWRSSRVKGDPDLLLQALSWDLEVGISNKY